MNRAEARPNEWSAMAARRTTRPRYSKGCPRVRASRSAERAGGGRRPRGEWVFPLGIRGATARPRHAGAGRRRDRGRRHRGGRRAGQVASGAGRAVGVVVNVVALDGLLDVRAKSRGGTRLGERNHRRDEQLYQPEQSERDDGRTRLCAERSTGSAGSSWGMAHAGMMKLRGVYGLGQRAVGAGAAGGHRTSREGERA